MTSFRHHRPLPRRSVRSSGFSTMPGDLPPGAAPPSPALPELPETVDGGQVIAHEKVAFYPVTLERKKTPRSRGA